MFRRRLSVSSPNKEGTSAHVQEQINPIVIEKDWQNNFQKANLRSQHLLQTAKFSDCQFLVGSDSNKKVIKAHKLMLAMGSPVFERMFYGELPEKRDLIEVTDVQPDAFQAMLQYIYFDEININTIEKVFEVFYAAKKYLILNLVEECIKKIGVFLKPTNACSVYEFAILFDESDLMTKSLEVIKNNTKTVLTDPSFNDIQFSTLLIILEQEYLTIDSEMDLFNALEKYVNANKMLDSNSCGETDKHKLIKQALCKIRFLNVKPEMFAKGPACSKLFIKEDALKILVQILNPSIQNLPMGYCTSRINRNKFSFIQPHNMNTGNKIYHHQHH